MVSFESRGGVPGAGAASGNAHTGAEPLRPESFRFWSARAAPAAPFASLSASILGGLGKPGADGSRVEAHTGYAFPPELCLLAGAKKCPSLAGLGVRSKRIVIKDINVYAVGVYVDAAAAKTSLAAFKKRPADEVAKDQAFYDAVLSSPAEKSLRLVISSRLVDRRKFLDALDERLAPLLKKAGEPSALDTFRKQFDDVHFEKGMEIAFTCVDNKKLVTKVAGKEKGAIPSPALCSSLFSIYLGADPVAKDAKDSFGRSMAAALHE